MAARCRLILDSCCDVPYELVEREGIDLVEFPYVMDNTEHSDDLFKSISAAEFYKKMRDGECPTTTQVPMHVYQEVFENAIKSGEAAVYLSFSGALSGSFDVAALVHEQLLAQYPDAELYLVDTRLASIAQGLLTYEALQQWERGLSAKELAAWAEEAINFVNVEFMVDDLEALRRGGRIPAGVAVAGAMLDVKPLLTIGLDGSLSLVGVARGRKKGIRHMFDFYLKNRVCDGGLNTVFLGNADCPKDMARLRAEIEKTGDNVLMLESSIGPVIGSHVGPGMMALVFWGKDRRESLSVADRIAKKVRSN